jgi:hypothetical protein
LGLFLIAISAANDHIANLFGVLIVIIFVQDYTDCLD